MMKPSINEVLPLFLAYKSEHPDWGALHCVLADGNVRDRDVEHATDAAIRGGQVHAYVLGLILMQMSKTQRIKLPKVVAQ